LDHARKCSGWSDLRYIEGVHGTWYMIHQSMVGVRDFHELIELIGTCSLSLTDVERKIDGIDEFAKTFQTSLTALIPLPNHSCLLRRGHAVSEKQDPKPVKISFSLIAASYQCLSSWL
jgi:hypothetical protein